MPCRPSTWLEPTPQRWPAQPQPPDWLGHAPVAPTAGRRLGLPPFYPKHLALRLGVPPDEGPIDPPVGVPPEPSRHWAPRGGPPCGAVRGPLDPKVGVCSTHAHRSWTEIQDGAVPVWPGALRSHVLGSGHTPRRGHRSRKFVICPCCVRVPPALRDRQGVAHHPTCVRSGLLPDPISRAAMGWRYQDHVRHAGWVHVCAGPAQGLRCGHCFGSRTGAVRDTTRTTIVEPRLCNVAADGQQHALDTRAQVPSGHSRADDG